MSAVDGSVADTPADVPVKAPRKFPLPCWTQDETLVLIDAYRERWYSLRRGYLRTADWDAVAATVADRCPDASPAKTSAQCRHKIEKLRQRYRAEKQRSLSFPYPSGRYISSWFFFDKMEAMENGTTSNRIPENSDELSHMNSSLDQNKLKLKLKANNSVDPYSDLKMHTSAQANRFSSDSKEATRKDEEEEEEEDMSSDEDLQNLGTRRIMYGIPIHPLNTSSKKSGKNFPNYFGMDDGFYQDTLSPGNPSRPNNTNEELWEKISNNGNNCNSNFVPKPTANRSKWGSRPVEKMVASIQSLGEGFMKMEQAKMEMAREMEAMRMEMEMKRSEMILESQKQIIDAIVKGLLTVKKNKRAKSDSKADLAET